MLETIREYALERWRRAARSGRPAIATPAIFRGLAERGQSLNLGTGDPALLDVLDREHDNLRAALAWSRDTGDHDTLLRLAGALAFFWYYRGHLNEGRRWLDQALANARRCWLATAAGVGPHDAAGCSPTSPVRRTARPRC